MIFCRKEIEGKELIKYFCVPCTPTKANGSRTRNLPEHAPEKWAQFKAYNKRDVEVEMAIQDKLRKFPVPDLYGRNTPSTNRLTTVELLLIWRLWITQ